MNNALITTNGLSNTLICLTKPKDNGMTEFEKYNAFLAEALERCANVRTPYDRPSKVPINTEELEKFCAAAARLGLPVIYVGKTIEDNGYYAAYPTWDMLNEMESER